MEADLAEARREMADLRLELQELKDRLNNNSSNSSIPPSANPPGAPPPVKKKPTGRRPGGQLGHAGHGRKLLAEGEVDEVVKHRPVKCEHCGRAFGEGIQGTVTARHQVSELPPVAVVVTEHQSIECVCPGCRMTTAGEIPRDILCSAFGPRLSAVIAWSSAHLHTSRRKVVELLEAALGVPIALGTVSAREKEMADALERPHRSIGREVRAGAVKHMDETSWKGVGSWLWTAATRAAAYFHLDRSRAHGVVKTLLGREIEGVVCSDDYGAYARIPLKQRGLCWAHLKRHFTKWEERGDKTKWFGVEASAITRGVFKCWKRFKNGKPGQWSRKDLRQWIKPLRVRMKKLLERGIAGREKKLARFCGRLLRMERAIWRFTKVQGLEPTNNHAERMLRPAVIWRKICLGSASDRGCRFVERMLSVVATLRMRGRKVLDYLEEALRRHRRGQLPPALAG